MTNQEKLREIFPNTIFIYRMENEKTVSIICSDEWLNAEYQNPNNKEAEEEQEPTTKNDSPKYCDRNICLKNEYNNIGCEDCEVTKSQEPKTGHWISTYGNVKCSVCGSVKDSREVGKATHYCDFCGARMVEPQESEVEE